jgi:hypothetical protein
MSASRAPVNAAVHQTTLLALLGPMRANIFGEEENSKTQLLASSIDA